MEKIVTTRDATIVECIMNIRKSYSGGYENYAQGWDDAVDACEQSLKDMLPPELRDLKAFK